MVLELRLQEQRFVEAGDGEPVAAIVSENGERFGGAVAVGVGFDDRDDICIGARGLLAQDAVVAAQSACARLLPRWAGWTWAITWTVIRNCRRHLQCAMFSKRVNSLR